MKYKKLSARICSLALSAAMIFTILPMNVFAAEGGTAPGVSSVGTIQSFGKLGDPLVPSTGKDASSHVYVLTAMVNTPFEDLDLPAELTAMVARATTVNKPAADEDTETDDTVSGNQPVSPSDAQEETIVTTIESETIPVSWNSDKKYTSETKGGKFIFTAELPEGYILANGMDLPQIYVLVGKQGRAAVVTGEGYSIDKDTGVLTVTTNDGTQNWRNDKSILRKDVTSVILTDNVTEIIGNGFNSCSNLTYINTNKVTSITGNQVFTGSGLKSIDMPNVTTITQMTFYCQWDIVSVTMPKVSNIGANVFERCMGLTTMTLPAVPPTVGTDAFKKISASVVITLVDADGVPLTGKSRQDAINAYESDTGFQDGKWWGMTLPVGFDLATLIDNSDPGKGYIKENGILTVTGDAYFYGNGGSNVTGIVVQNDAALTLDGVTINSVSGNCPIVLNGTGTNTIKLSGTNTLHYDGALNAAALCSESGSIVIENASKENASLTVTATNGSGQAGIFANGTLTINSGTIVASSTNGAGLSGGSGITINGGTVTASGDDALSGTLTVGTTPAPSITAGSGTDGSGAVSKTVAEVNAGNFNFVKIVYLSDAEQLAAAKPLAEAAINGIAATNSTTAEHIRTAVNTAISSVTGVTAAWKTGSPAIVQATTGAAGSITGTIVLTCGTKSVEVTVNKTIAKLDNGASSSDGGSSSDRGSGTPSTSNKDSLTNGQTTVTAPVDSKGKATLTITDKAIADAIKEAQEQAKKDGLQGKMISIEIVATTDKAATQVTATLPKTVQETLISNNVDSVKISTNTVALTFSQAAIQQINEQAKADVTITAAKSGTSKLTGDAKALIGSRPMFDFNATYGNGSKSITDFGGNTVSIAIPYTLGKGEVPGNLYAIYVDGNGKASKLTNSSYDSNQQAVIFTTSHFSKYGVGCRASNNFTDITDHWAKTDIEFVTNRSLMSGTSNSTFSPNGSITRAMFVTALGRLAGMDVNSYKNGKFNDVKAGAYYAPYVNWAAEKGIVSGTTAATFAPDKTVSRQEMAVFMSNYAKAMGYNVPETRAENPFADNASISSFAAAAVKQMQMAGVLNGKNNNMFDPAGTATRAEVSAALHRYVELVIDRSTAQGLDTNDSGSAMMYENGKAVKSASRTVNSSTYTFNDYGEAALLPADNKKTGTYTVKKGDSFWLIARKNDCTIAELEHLNRKNRYDIIYAGQVLKVPQK